MQFPENLIQILNAAKRVAVITGAGISQESGVPTFRGEGGLWKQFRAEELATPEAFQRNPVLVWEWYDYRRGICQKAEPNPGHLVLAEMENYFEEFLLITQNVDGLHGRAGNRKILEIHGNIWKARCTVCRKIYENFEVPLIKIPVRCPDCDSIARPHIVWFGENYDTEILWEANEFLSKSDIVLIIGTSGMVQIPVQLTEIAKRNGATTIEINPEKSHLTNIVSFHLEGKSGIILPELFSMIRNRK